MAVRNIGSLLAGLTLLLHTWGAWAIEISMEDRVEVRTGVSANITCMFSSDEGIGGIAIQWFYSEFKWSPSSEKKEIYAQQGTVREVRRGTLFTDRISVTGPGPRGDVVLTIDNVRVQDELEFICVVKDLEGGVAEGRTQLRVFDSPDDPTIEGVSVGFSVNEINPVKIGVCEVSNGYPKPNVTWYRNNTPLRNSDDVRVISTVTVESTGLMSVKSELHKKVVMEDKDARFYCEVSYFVPGMVKMVETKRIGVDVLYPSTAVELWVQLPKGKIQEGDTVELRCKGNGNSPASISIGRKDTDLVGTDEFVLENVTRQDSGDYQCTSMDIETIEEVSGHIRVDVHYLDPAVVIPDDVIVADGGEVEATCNASSSLRTTTAWFKNGDMVSQGHTLIRTEDTAGTYTCVVTVPEIEGMNTSATLRVRVKGPPRITNDGDTEIEESFGNTVELRCTVRGFPPLSLTWSTADGKVIEEATQTDTDDGIEGLANIKVDADVTVLCKASNEYGSDALTFSIKATKHTTSPANAPTSTSTSTTSTTSTTTTTTNTTTTTMSSATVKAETAVPPKKIKKEGSGVVIAVIIICILLLAILGSVLYFLYKTGKICGRAGKQDLTKGQSNKDNIVVEMKSDNTEEAILLGVNGEKQPPSDQ